MMSHRLTALEVLALALALALPLVTVRADLGGAELGRAAIETAGDLPNIIIVLADDQGWSDVGYNAVPSRQYQPGAGGTKAEGGS